RRSGRRLRLCYQRGSMRAAYACRRCSPCTFCSPDARMDLERLSVKLRQRSPWEAIDLGFAMAREWWRDVYGMWLVIFIPSSVTLCVLLPIEWAALTVWWLKPALDRVVLQVLATRVFCARGPWRRRL